jgi:L-methionine (R)-S-oxide reductase
MTEPALAKPVREIEELLAAQGVSDASLQNALDKILAHFDCVAGTLHGLNRATALLELRAARNIPQNLLSKVTTIPIGKGMAGLAAERRKPVQVCNLQTDTTGVAKPSAKETRMEGSIAVPLLCETVLTGVLGIAKPIAYEFSQGEVSVLENVGAVLARYL